MIAVLTRPDNAFRDQSLSDLLRGLEEVQDEELLDLRKMLITDIQRRVIGFENDTEYNFERTTQCRHLLHIVDQMLQCNSGVYRNAKFDRAQELVSEYEEEVEKQRDEMREECLTIPEQLVSLCKEQKLSTPSDALKYIFGKVAPEEEKLSEYFKIMPNREYILQNILDKIEKNREISETQNVSVENLEWINDIILGQLHEYRDLRSDFQQKAIEVDVADQLKEEVDESEHEALLAHVPSMILGQKELFTLIEESITSFHEKIAAIESMVVESLYEFNTKSNEIHKSMASHMSNIKESVQTNREFTRFPSWVEFLCDKRRDRLMRIYEMLSEDCNAFL